MSWEAALNSVIREKPIGAEFTIEAFSLFPNNEHNLRRVEQFMHELRDEGIVEIVAEGRYRRIDRADGQKL